MKIIVIGGSGLIGEKLVANLSKLGHEAVSASPSSGVNTLTGEGLAEALAGANWPPRRLPASGTTSPCQWSEPTV